MTYREKFLSLKSVFNQNEKCIQVPSSNILIHNFDFSSESHKVLPGAGKHICEFHNLSFSESNSPGDIEGNYSFLHKEDYEIIENRRFRYSIFKTNDSRKAKDIIFLFHGLNEKKWDKYLPWAEQLVELTGKAVILFPIAFHMNRAPLDWSDAKLMMEVSNARKKEYPSLMNSSFANAAISARINNNPKRFFWSGLQTYYDIIQLVGEIKAGKHELISDDAKFRFFSYSIGSFLSQIILMSDHDGYFTGSKLFMFCGGPTFDRMTPVSKYIIDSDSNIALYSFYIEHLENEIKKDERLKHYFGGSHGAGKYFRTMLNYKNGKVEREKRFKELAADIFAIPLLKDDVIQAGEVLNTLQGDFRDIPVNVKVLDFDYNYTHVSPFSEVEKIEPAVDMAFNEVFQLAANHLS